MTRKTTTGKHLPISAAMLVQTAGVALADKSAEWGLPALGGWVVERDVAARSANAVAAFASAVDDANAAALIAGRVEVQAIAKAKEAAPHRVPGTLGGINLRAAPRPGADRAVVFRKRALLPWLEVIENVAFGLKLQGMAEREQVAMASKFLPLLGPDGFEKSPVHALSGGMQLRVGIARALTCAPRILLMDERPGALDPLTREKVQDLILGI